MTTPDRLYRPIDPTAVLDLRAGPAKVSFVNGAVRWVSVRGIECVRGIYGAVRDPSWGTIEPAFSSCEAAIDDVGFEIRLRADCIREADGIDFAWTGVLTGAASGTIRFRFEGVARSSFLTPRVGLCVLHPTRLAGEPVEVQTPFGQLRGKFPDLVTGLMPFSNVVQMRHDLRRVHETQIDFSGELFQMEDQRAFTDASFKTFCRPLELPQPYKIDAGTTICQGVMVSFPRLRSDRPRARSRRDDHALKLRVGTGPDRTFPAIGAALPPPGIAVIPQVGEAVAALGLAHLRATVDAARPDAGATLDAAIEDARRAGTALEVVLIVEPNSASIAPLMVAIAQSDVPVARLLPVDPARHTTSAALAAEIRRVMQRVGLVAPLVGGTRGYFYQLLTQGVPVDLVDLVSYPTNPQVHAFDDATIIESLATLPATVRTAGALAAGRPVAVGPVSLKPLFNPDLTGPELPAPVGSLPGRYDRRQTTALTAAWTLGCAAAFASAGAISLTLHETAGWAGLIAAETPGLPSMPAAPGTVLAVGRVVEALARLRAARHIPSEVPSPLQAIAARTPDGNMQLLIANLGGEPHRVDVFEGGRALTIDEVARLRLDPVGGAAWVAERASMGLEIEPRGVIAAMVRTGTRG